MSSIRCASNYPNIHYPKKHVFNPYYENYIIQTIQSNEKFGFLRMIYCNLFLKNLQQNPEDFQGFVFYEIAKVVLKVMCNFLENKLSEGLK